MGQLTALKEDFVERKYIKNVIVGQTWEAALAFQKLTESKESKGEVLVCLSGEFSPRRFVPKGPTQCRHLANKEYLSKKFEGVEFTEQKSFFLKEGELKNYSSRIKGEPLLKGEEYYTKPGWAVPAQKLLKATTIEQVRESALSVPLVKIEKKVPQDLIEKAQFCLSFSDQSQIECENLIWAQSPFLFYRFFEPKEDLSDEIIQYFESTQSMSKLIVRLTCNDLTWEKSQTLLLPLSYTHEWGHFIGEWKETQEEGISVGEFIHLFDGEQNNEEDIGKKIKILKRQLEKIYPQFSLKIKAEEIIVEVASECQKIDDRALGVLRKELPGLFIANSNAPLEDLGFASNSFEYSLLELSHMGRSVASLDQIQI